MKVKHKEVERISFGVLNAGEVFEFGAVYIKVDIARLVAGAGFSAAVNVKTGELRYFHDDSHVRHLPDAFMTVE